LKPPLLLYLAHAGDLHRCAVGPALAVAAERAGWAFDAYYDCRRSGRHFGGPLGASAEDGSGSLVAGGRHLELALWLGTRYKIAAIGDQESPLWPVIEAAGEIIARTDDPAEIFAATLTRLGLPAPEEVFVLDAAEQAASRIVTAPFLYPRIHDGRGLGIDVTCDASLRQRPGEPRRPPVHWTCSRCRAGRRLPWTSRRGRGGSRERELRDLQQPPLPGAMPHGAVARFSVILG
jgi:hypothetical protein